MLMREMHGLKTPQFKKAAAIACFIFLAGFYTSLYAALDKASLKKFLVYQEAVEYENPEYKTTEEYIKAFEDGKCSSVWLWMHMDERRKIHLVDNLKETFMRNSKAVVRKPSGFYVKALDEAVASDPQAKNYKLAVLFRALAIIEYDYDEGIDKEETAKNWLGSAYPIFKEYRAQGE